MLKYGVFVLSEEHIDLSVKGQQIRKDFHFCEIEGAYDEQNEAEERALDAYSEITDEDDDKNVHVVIGIIDAINEVDDPYDSVSFDGIRVISEVVDIDESTTVIHFDEEVYLSKSQ